MRSCKGRLDNELLKLKTPLRMVVNTLKGVAGFELLPPFGSDLSLQHRAKFDRACALLAATFPKNAKQIKTYVYRNRSPDGTRSTEETTYDACLVAGLWLKDDLVSAASLRVNILPNGGQHVETVYQATEPNMQQRGLGRLLTRCIIKAAAVAGHKYATVVVLGKEVAGYWTKMGFSTTTHRDEHGAITAVAASQLHAPKSAVWLMHLWASEERLEEVEAEGPEAVARMQEQAAEAAGGSDGGAPQFTLEQALAVVEAQNLVNEAAKKVEIRFGAVPSSGAAAGGGSQTAVSGSKGAPGPATTSQQKAGPAPSAATPATRRRGRGERGQAAKAAAGAVAGAAISTCTQGSVDGTSLTCPPQPPRPQLTGAAWPPPACDVDSVPTSPGPVGQQGGGGGFDSVGGTAAAAAGTGTGVGTEVLLPPGVKVVKSGFGSGDDDDEIDIVEAVRAGGVGRGGSSAGGSSVEGGGGGGERGCGENPAPAAAAVVGKAPRDGSAEGLAAAGDGYDGVVAEKRREGSAELEMGALRTAKRPRLAGEAAAGVGVAVEGPCSGGGGAGGVSVPLLRLCPSLESRSSRCAVREGKVRAHTPPGGAEVPAAWGGSGGTTPPPVGTDCATGRGTAATPPKAAAAAVLTPPTASGCGRGSGGDEGAANGGAVRCRALEKPPAAVTDNICDLTLESPLQASAGGAAKASAEPSSSVEVLGEVQGGAWMAAAGRGVRTQSRGMPGGCSGAEPQATPGNHHTQQKRSEPSGRAASKPAEAAGSERLGAVPERAPRDGEGAAVGGVQEEEDEVRKRERRLERRRERKREKEREKECEDERNRGRARDVKHHSPAHDVKHCRTSAERHPGDPHLDSRRQPSDPGAIAAPGTNAMDDGRSARRERIVDRVAAHIAAYAATHNLVWPGLDEHSTPLAASLITALGGCRLFSAAAEGRTRRRRDGGERGDDTMLSEDGPDDLISEDSAEWSDVPAPRPHASKGGLLCWGAAEQQVEIAGPGPNGQECRRARISIAAGDDAQGPLAHGSVVDRQRDRSRTGWLSGGGQSRDTSPIECRGQSRERSRADCRSGSDSDARRHSVSPPPPPPPPGAPRSASEPQAPHGGSSGEAVVGRCGAPSGHKAVAGDKRMDAGGVKRNDTNNKDDDGGKSKCAADGGGGQGTGTTGVSGSPPAGCAPDAGKPVPPEADTGTTTSKTASAGAAVGGASVGAEALPHGQLQQERRREGESRNGGKEGKQVTAKASRISRWGSVPVRVAGAAGLAASSDPPGAGRAPAGSGGNNACEGSAASASLPLSEGPSHPLQPPPPSTGPTQVVPQPAAKPQASAGCQEPQKPAPGSQKAPPLAPQKQQPGAATPAASTCPTQCPKQQPPQQQRASESTAQPLPRTSQLAHPPGKEPGRPTPDAKTTPGGPTPSDSGGSRGKAAAQQQSTAGALMRPQQQRPQPQPRQPQSTSTPNDPVWPSDVNPLWRKPTATVSVAASAAPLQQQQWKPSWPTSQPQPQGPQQLSPWRHQQRLMAHQQQMHMEQGHYLQQVQANRLSYWPQALPHMYPYSGGYYQNYK